MWLTRRHWLLAAAGVGHPIIARATSLLDLPAGPIALNGFDAVSYFLDGPEAGRPAYEWAWHGRTWRFARAGNLEAFRRDPIAYAPRLGGFDAVGILDGRLVDTDPLIFARLSGPDGGDRLYLFRNEAHRAQAMADPSLAPRAEARWPTLQEQRDRNLSD